MSKIKEIQKINPKHEKFIPPQILEIFKKLQSEAGNPAEPRTYNSWFKINRPEIARSTVSRWTRAFLSGEYNEQTPEWHSHYKDEPSLVPDKFSSIKSREYHEQIKRIRSGGVIRYANVSCIHFPTGDPALWGLAKQVIGDFCPNVFPMLSDFLDNTPFNRHSAQPATTTFEKQNTQQNRYTQFIDHSLFLVRSAKEVLPDDCLLLNMWGNHENWILRQLVTDSQVTGDSGLQQFFIDNYFSALANEKVLWVEMDKRRYAPLTDYFWVGHGHRTRSKEGGTALSYLESARYALSFAVGHTHRQEVIWAKTALAERFAAVSGTLGPLRRNYNFNDIARHNWGFQLITHPAETWKGVVIDDVRIFYEDGEYRTTFRGKTYSQRATFEYDEIFDLIEIGVG